MDNDVMTHLTLAGVVSLIIEAAKRSNSPKLAWISASSDTVSRVISGVFAIGIGFGITVMGDQSTGWTIHVPSLIQLQQHIWEAFSQFILQELVYRGTIKPHPQRPVIEDEPMPPTGPRATLPTASAH